MRKLLKLGQEAWSRVTRRAQSLVEGLIFVPVGYQLS